MNRLSVVPYEVRWCPRCNGERPHSKRGRCMAMHRTSSLPRSKPLRTAKPRDDEKDARWEVTKVRVFERDGWRCQRCGMTRGLDPHHRALIGAGGTSDDDRQYGLANLITLCRSCHDIVHTVLPREDAERLGFIIPRFPGDDPESVPVLTIHGRVFLLAGGSRVAVAAEPGGAQ